MTLQILNLSIDTDYLFYYSSYSPGTADLDDIDSFTEYLVERIAGDDRYTSEDDNDDASSRDKGLENYNVSPLYFEQFTNPQLFYYSSHISSWTPGLDQANKTSKGYFTLISPPPEA